MTRKDNLDNGVEILINILDFAMRNKQHLELELPNRLFIECMGSLMDLNNTREIE